MRKMTNTQIDTLNELLINNCETLTSFYDEAIDVGIRKGFIIGATISLISGITIYGVTKLKRRKKLNEEERA